MNDKQRPDKLRVVVFIDGQNFYHDCKRRFDHGNTHPHILARELCESRFGENRDLVQVRFYTGIHSAHRKPERYSAMSRRLELMKANDVWVFSRPLRYGIKKLSDHLRTKVLEALDDNCEDCKHLSSFSSDLKNLEINNIREKGVDVRIALDLVMLAIIDTYDVAVLVSTDTDLDEAVEEVQLLQSQLNRWLAVENAILVPEIDPKTDKRPPYKRLRSARRLLHIDQELFSKIKDDTQYTI